MDLNNYNQIVSRANDAQKMWQKVVCNQYARKVDSVFF